MKKKLVIFLSVLAIGICTFAICCFAFSGSGTSSDPYIIDGNGSVQAYGSYTPFFKFDSPYFTLSNSSSSAMLIQDSTDTTIYTISGNSSLTITADTSKVYHIGLTGSSYTLTFSLAPTPTPEPTPTPDPRQSVLNDFGSMVTGGGGMMGTITTFITNNAIVVVPLFLFFVIGGAIAIVKRIKRNK